MDAWGGHLPNPYQLDVAYVGGQPVGTVEKITLDEPDPGRRGTRIRRALREEFTVGLWEPDPRDLGNRGGR